MQRLVARFKMQKSPSNDFDSSDEEDGVADQDKLDITWYLGPTTDTDTDFSPHAALFSFSRIPLPDRDGEALGLSALPGMRT